jgi:hypothetical protein
LASEHEYKKVAGEENVDEKTVSGWELAHGEENALKKLENVEREAEETGYASASVYFYRYPDIILVGGVLVLIAAVGLLLTARRFFRALLATGAVFAAGYLWFHFLTASTSIWKHASTLAGTTTTNTSITAVGLGMYLALIGSVLVLVSLFGLFGTKEEAAEMPSEPPPIV